MSNNDFNYSFLIIHTKYTLQLTLISYSNFTSANWTLASSDGGDFEFLRSEEELTVLAETSDASSNV